MDFTLTPYLKKPSFTTRTMRTVVACLSLLCAPVWAALGGNADTVLSDQQAFGASGTAQPIAGATLYTQTLPNGITIRQYVDPAGMVFAVGWEGPVLPDFQRLLGAYFSTYQAGLSQQRRGVQLRNSDLVLESGGMMRAFVGRAYLPPKLPAALGAQDIR